MQRYHNPVTENVILNLFQNQRIKKSQEIPKQVRDDDRIQVNRPGKFNMVKELLKSIGNFILDTIETIVIALAMFAMMYLFLAQPHQVHGESMLPNFEDKEYLLTEKVTYYFREPKRGEVVIFKFPKAHEYDYIKRLIGLPEETMLIEDGKIKVFNAEHPEGFILDEPYLDPQTKTQGRTIIKPGQKFHIPKGHYVLMGDNREKSSDSREWGTVKRDELIGRAWLRYWPPRALAFIPKTEYKDK